MPHREEAIKEERGDRVKPAKAPCRSRPSMLIVLSVGRFILLSLSSELYVTLEAGQALFDTFETYFLTIDAFNVTAWSYIETKKCSKIRVAEIGQGG